MSADPSTGQLIGQLSEQTSKLVRDELELAKLELKASARHGGMGVGLFGAAGILGLFGVGSLIATAIIALDLAMPLWLAALIVTVVVLAIAAIMAIVGKGQVQQASPTPDQAVANAKLDAQEFTGGRHD